MESNILHDYLFDFLVIFNIVSYTANTATPHLFHPKYDLFNKNITLYINVTTIIKYIT